MTAPRRYDPSPDRAAAIRRARDRAQMSERDLARALGVSQTTVRAWEAAMRDPGPDMAARIAVAARVPVSALLMPTPAGAGWRYEAELRDARSCGWPATRKAAA